MATLLRVDSSARQDGSHSRDVADRIMNIWKSQNPGGHTVERKIGDGSVPHISNDTIQAFFTDPAEQTGAQKQAIVTSDHLVEELQAADTLLVSVPFYNFSVPSSLKAWIDQVVRVNRTFAIGEDGFSGLARARRAIVVIAYGAPGYQAGGSLASANFAEPYLKFLLEFIGIPDVTILSLDGTNEAEDVVERRKRQLTETARQVLSRPLSAAA